MARTAADAAAGAVLVHAALRGVSARAGRGSSRRPPTRGEGSRSSARFREERRRSTMRLGGERAPPAPTTWRSRASRVGGVLIPAPRWSVEFSSGRANCPTTPAHFPTRMARRGHRRRRSQAMRVTSSAGPLRAARSTNTGCVSPRGWRYRSGRRSRVTVSAAASPVCVSCAPRATVQRHARHVEGAATRRFQPTARAAPLN